MKALCTIAAVAAVVISLLVTSPATPATASPSAVAVTTTHTISGHLEVDDQTYFSPNSVVVHFKNIGDSDWAHDPTTGGLVEAAVHLDGTFSIDVGASTDVILQFQNNMPNYITFQTADDLAVVGSPGVYHVAADITGLQLTMTKPAAVNLHVTDKAGSPQEPIQVGVTRYNSDGSIDHNWAIVGGQTGQDGFAQLYPLPAGTYSLDFLEIGLPYGAPHAFIDDQSINSTADNPAGDKPFTIAFGQTLTMNVALVRSASIAASVSCQSCTSSDSISAGIERLDASNSWVAVDAAFDTDQAGSFTFSQLYPATYRLHLYYTGPNDFNDVTSNPFTVGDGQSIQKSFVLTRPPTSSPGVQAATSSYLTALYVDFLNRKPAASEVAGWSKFLAAGNPRTVVSLGFVNSDEYRLIRIDTAYRQILAREPDAGGRSSWLSGMKNGLLTTDDIESSFYASDEFYARAGKSDIYWVAALYSALIGRQASYNEAASWAATIPTHGRLWLVNQIWNSVETARSRVSLMYKFYLGRTPDLQGVINWANLDIAVGDTAIRSGITSSDEYYLRAQTLYPLGTPAPQAKTSDTPELTPAGGITAAPVG
ncbi:MAG: hypothetical protein JWQ64_2282 [Subtercola sp.]|nr:hypothetical protein [Subtercola sp.]